LIAQQLLRDGEPLPGELASWMADVLARKCSRPTARGKDPDANFVRNRAIVDAVQWLVQQGFRATRSKAMAVPLAMQAEDSRSQQNDQRPDHSL
jgi:hypothetical protein